MLNKRKTFHKILLVFFFIVISILFSGTLKAGFINTCRNLSTEGTTYILTADVTTTSTCMNITANNVALICNGHKITYSSGGATGYGIVSHANYSTVQDCIIESGNSGFNSGYAIYFFGAKYASISDNIIITSGINQYGVYFRYSNYSEIINNNITTFGLSAYGMTLDRTGNINISDNYIKTYSGSPSSPAGILLNYVGYASVKNNVFVTNGSSAYGIWIAYVPFRIDIINNTITTSDDYSYGIYFASSLTSLYDMGVNFINNTITTSGDFSHGFRISYTISCNYTSNIIKTSGREGNGVEVYGVIEDTILSGMNITTTGLNSTGFYIIGLGNFTFLDSSIKSRNYEFNVSSARAGGTWNFTNVSIGNGSTIRVRWNSKYNGTLYSNWYLNAHANYSNSTGVYMVNVSIRNKNKAIKFSNRTNPDGDIATAILMQVRGRNGSWTYYSNYTINASITGQTEQSQSWNMTTNRWLNFPYDGDSCVYLGGDWIINISDNCILANDTDMGTNRFVVNGSSGRLKIIARIFAKKIYYTPADFNDDFIVNVANPGLLSVNV